MILGDTVDVRVEALVDILTGTLLEAKPNTSLDSLEM